MENTTVANAAPTTAVLETEPATDVLVDALLPDPLLADELLVEEISIDGMCGVY
jgi:mycofactocin precursor